MSNEYAPDSRQSVDLKWKLRKALEKNVAPRDDGKGIDFGQDVGVDGKLHLNELSDIVGPSGSPLFTDSTQEEVSSKVSDLARGYYIGKYSGTHLFSAWIASFDELVSPAIIENGATNFDLCFNNMTVGFTETSSKKFDCPDIGFDYFYNGGSYRGCFSYSFDEETYVTLGNFSGNCEAMFFACKAKAISVRDGKIAMPVNASYMFTGCSNLETLSGIDFTNANSLVGAFTGDSKLSLIDCKHFRLGFDVGNTALTHDAIVTLINSLDTVTSPQTLILGDEKLALLSDEEKLGATNKGWTLA